MSSNSPTRKQPWSEHETVLSAITLALGDIQLANSVAYSASALYLLYARDLSAYHYDVVCYLGIAATFTSVATMLSPPLYIQKKWISAARVTLFSSSVVLLGILLGKRFEKRHIFPVRAPSSAAGKNSALVLQTSCLIFEQIPKDCKFATDPRPIYVMTDILANVILFFLLMLVASHQSNWHLSSLEYGNKDTQDVHQEWLKRGVSRGRLYVELVVVSSAAAFVAVALWQLFDLRAWMNNSGLLQDDKERAVTSFGALSAFYSLFSLLLLLATSFDGKCGQPDH